jgi:hypothetical protein
MILNKYNFGSIVYGTNTEKSDEDYICVTDEKVISNDINIHYYTIEEFQRLLDNHEIQMLECYFIDDKFKHVENHKFNFELNLSKLRVSISTITSNSWVKGKKKLIVMADYDKYIAIKSIFHSIRILDLGIQIATYHRIINYSEYNWLFFDLLKLSEQHDYIDLWNIIDSKYRKLFNKLSSDFKKLAPLEKEYSIDVDIENILKDFNIYNIDLKDVIVEYIRKI